jgi:hypothetical protein
MKIIDKTPFFNDKGEISLIDRVKALMKFGKPWLDEIEAQKTVLSVLDKALDKSYTLLRNVTPPGLDTAIPFILIGPSGVFVMYVTHLVGMFRAKGDQWGTVVGNAFKPEKPNLLKRTEQMARVVQVYLERHGYSDLTGVEAILLCADPGVHVDSLRPIVRIVMRDALERLAISINQARVVLVPEAVFNVVNLILNPPEPKEETPEPIPAKEPTAGSPQEAVSRSEVPAERLTPGDTRQSAPAAVASRPRPPRKTFSRKQWIFLAAMLIVWCLIMAIFIVLVAKDFLP